MDYVISQLKTTGPYNSTGFLATQNFSLTENIQAYAFKNISEYFVDGFDVLLSPLAAKVIRSDGIMGYHGVPQFPLYVYKAVKDEVSPINDTDALVAKYCDMGVNILYQRNSIGGHAADAVNGHAAAVAWLDSVFGGSHATKYNTTGCITQQVAVNVSSSQL